MNHLVQLLLPLYDKQGRRNDRSRFDSVRSELTTKFGGLTCYARTPIEGLWKPDESTAVERDDLVIYEVMVREVNRSWWKEYRESLEARFDQAELVIRCHSIELL